MGTNKEKMVEPKLLELIYKRILSINGVHRFPVGLRVTQEASVQPSQWGEAIEIKEFKKMVRVKVRIIVQMDVSVKVVSQLIHTIVVNHLSGKTEFRPEQVKTNVIVEGVVSSGIN